MTPFVESFFTKQLLPPWISEGCLFHGFVVKVAEGNVRGYLDLYLNGTYPERAPYYYEPLPGPQFGLFTIAEHPKVSSQFPGHAVGWDTIRHNEVYWTLPVRRWSITPDNMLVDCKVVWVQPLSMDDNPTLVFASREIWGGDIVIADVHRDPNPPPGGLHVDVAIQGFRTFDANSKAELLACVHAVIDEDARVDGAELLESNTELRDFAALLGQSGMFAGDDTAAQDSDAVQGVELNNLKQFRTAEEGKMGLAIYRAIVASRTWHTDIANLTFYAPGKSRLDVFWSDSMAEILSSIFDIDGSRLDGTPPAEHAGFPIRNGIHWDLPRASLPVELAFSFTSNVNFKVERTLHTYGG